MIGALRVEWGSGQKKSQITNIADTQLLSLWFLLSLGMMALSGTEISGDIYAWMAVLVLPINSALNPFLYTLSAILGKKVNKILILFYA